MAEPITLAEAKAHLSIPTDQTNFDTFITSLIAPARAYVERVSRHVFVAGERTETLNQWGDYLELWRRPIASVDTVAYVDEAGDAAEYTGFLADLGRFPLRIYPGVDDEFPGMADGGAITVTYTTGAIDTTSEEYLIGKQAMLLLIGHWFNNREAVVIGDASSEVDFAVRSLLDAVSPLSAY
jgi:uncharacterized phiE125 gp8 family phage protein